MDIIDMQNWKKQIISDPLLNCLLLPTLDSQQILNNHILTLSQTQVVNVYTRLASLKHSLTKSIQKEVEHRHEKLEQSFQETYRLQKNYSLANQTALFTQMRQLEKFNEKYETVEETLPTYINACKLIHYAKALERFRVNVRLLKTLMKDTHVINAVKTSKIIKQLTTLSLKYDFTGLQTYEAERAFLYSSRETLQQIVGKELTALLALTSQEEVVFGKIQVLQNLNKLKEFLTTFYKNMAKEAGQCLKKAFTIPTQVDLQSVPSVFNEYSKQVICARLYNMSCTLLYLQELLLKNNVNVTMPNLFEKFWEKIIQFLGDLIKWNVEQEGKDNSTKSLISVVEAKLEGKLDSRYLHSTVWKYPSLFSAVTALANQVHLYIAENVHYYDYDFSARKEDLIFVLLPLSLLYYRAIHNFVEQISSKIINVGWKNGERLRSMFVELVEWLLSYIEVKEIYEKVVWECIEGLEALKKQPMEAQGRREFKFLCKNIKHALKKKEQFLFQGNEEIEQIVCRFKALEAFPDK